MDPRNQPSLLERIYSWENLLDAYHEAASEKWYRNDVTAFAANLEENLISIQNDLIWHTYKVGRYRQFYVHEPKKRLVMALGFRDRVVQWAIYLQTNQYLDNGMIYHSYGCRVGKGTTRAADRLQYWCTLVDRKPGKWYYLKLDVSKYFYRVDHRVLLDILRRKFPNEDGYAAVLAVLKKATSVRQASDAVLLKYEQPKDQSASVQTKRASYGQTYFNKYATKTTNDTQGGKTMSNSSLVDCTVYSPNHSGKRTHSIDRLTPHCVVGQLSAETIGACFPKGRNASCNYGIGYDGRVCLIVDECNRSWCSSSNANDQRAITIECASDKAEPYAMKSAVYEKLIKLCADICKRNGKTKVLWLGSKEKALAYEPKANEIVLTAHRWFANKSCPGDWLYSRYGELADRINALLGSTDSGNSGGNNTPSGGSGVKYYVQTGAYKQKANADAQLKKVKAAGFDAILKQSGGFYKVQTGAYSKKENANAEVAKLKAKGFDAIVTTNGGSAAGSANSEIKVGDVVQFSGGPHYGSAAASTAAGTPKAGPAKVTRIVKGAKHPYHIVHTDGQSSVYGWVNAANVSK